VKKAATLCPIPATLSRALPHALFAGGAAASPASFTFSPLYFAPSDTVLPTPLAVSATPSGIFLAPV